MPWHRILNINAINELIFWSSYNNSLVDVVHYSSFAQFVVIPVAKFDMFLSMFRSSS